MKVEHIILYQNVKISDALCSGSIATVDEILLDGLSRPLLNSTAVPLKLRLAWVALLSEKMRGILFGKGCDPLVKRSHDLLNIRGQRQIWRWSSGRTPYFIFLICILPYFVAAHRVRPVGILTALMKQRASKWPRGASEAHFFGRPSDTFTES